MAEQVKLVSGTKATFDFYKRICAYPKIRAVLFGTLSQTVNSDDFYVFSQQHDGTLTTTNVVNLVCCKFIAECPLCLQHYSHEASHNAVLLQQPRLVYSSADIGISNIFINKILILPLVFKNTVDTMYISCCNHSFRERCVMTYDH